LPRIGETPVRQAPLGSARDEQGRPEEIQATLERNMRGLLDGRITVKEANRITHAASVQLYLLRLLGQLERGMERERESKCRKVEK